MTPAINTTPVKVHHVQQRTVKPISPVNTDSTLFEHSNKSISPRIQAPASPILKAQLSAPPKPSSNSPNQPQNPVTKVDSKSQVGPSPCCIRHSFMPLVLIMVYQLLTFLFILSSQKKKKKKKTKSACLLFYNWLHIFI